MKQKKVIGLILSLVLVLCVAVPGTLASENLNQPALICEKTEHVHGDGCRTVPETPACGMETGAGAHTHDGNCYGVLRGLTCTLPEDGNHTHGAECYGELKTLVCTVTEDENHTHGGECYAPKTGLVCDLAESAGHIHGESCYPTVFSCTLEEHTHDAACYTAPLSEEENEPTCTCGSVDGTHVAGCPLYVAPTCTCGSVDGTHVAGCPLYVAPTCTCIANEDGTLTYTEGCPVHEAPAAESEHIEGCSDECTNVECTCKCHLFERLMKCETMEEIFIMLEQYTDEEIEAALSEEEMILVGQKIDGLMPQPLPEIVIDENGNVVSDELSDEPSDEEPFISEVEYLSVNFDYVAPFGDPVVG